MHKVYGACTLLHAAGIAQPLWAQCPGRDALHHAASAIAGFNLTAGLVIDHALFCDANVGRINPSTAKGGQSLGREDLHARHIAHQYPTHTKRHHVTETHDRKQHLAHDNVPAVGHRHAAYFAHIDDR